MQKPDGNGTVNLSHYNRAKPEYFEARGSIGVEGRWPPRNCGDVVRERFPCERGLMYTIVIGDEAVARSFGTIGFPTLAVIAPDGQVDSLHVGLIEISALGEIVASVRPPRSI